MIPSVYERLHITPGVSAVIVSLALMLIAGFAMTRLTSKLRLPNVTAYIVSGILLGPFCLDLVPRGVIDGMSFLADIALAFIAFSTGEFFRISTLKKSGTKGARHHSAGGMSRLGAGVSRVLFPARGWISTFRSCSARSPQPPLPPPR